MTIDLDTLASEAERIPYVHGRDLLPIRKVPIETRNKRVAAAFAEEDRIRSEINDLDAEVIRLSQRRRALLDRLRAVQETIRPRVLGMSGRRRRAVSHEERLPAAAPDATRIIGRELRHICLALLATAKSSTTLRSLHVLLHRSGYLIDHPRPGKALADALGHEVDIGRVKRVRRGAYEIMPGVGLPRVALPDW